jgi:short-subunit dehydrogenase
MPELALVTGASSGIGAEIARVLAARRIDLVLSARRLDRLEALAAELRERHGVAVTCLACDLAAAGGGEELHRQVRDLGLPISMLINNAGFGAHGALVEQDLSLLQSMIRLNVMATTTLTRLFAADMRTRGQGRILNVSSFSAVQPPPWIAAYAATKSYLLTLSRTLNWELRGTGVTVSALCPGFARTEFYDVAEMKPSLWVRLMMLPPELIARAGVKGMLRGKSVIVPNWFYKLIAFTGRFMPDWLSIRLADWLLKAG